MKIPITFLLDSRITQMKGILKKDFIFKKKVEKDEYQFLKSSQSDIDKKTAGHISSLICTKEITDVQTSKMKRIGAILWKKETICMLSIPFSQKVINWPQDHLFILESFYLVHFDRTASKYAMLHQILFCNWSSET